MMINILFTLLLIVLLLGGIFLLEGKICLIKEAEIGDFVIIKYDLMNGLSLWAVKLVLKGLYLLNTVILVSTPKATQTTLIQLQNLNFKG
ncbi:hypothetical protein [Falsiporphyromonas endometrii]|uniref:Uncharacterized protein n=1 Tax=Falsiporphyromonas endometrii TaxID=1387297 RepID=A0ABV9K5P5_9PORP